MAGEPKTVGRFETRGFLQRTLLYATGLFVGCTLCVSIITVAQKYTVSTPKVWPYVLDWFRFWVWPVMVAEMIRSPLAGLFYALLGPARYTRSRILGFGATCGLVAYGFAYFFSVVAGRGPEMRQIVSGWNLIQGSTLGVPLILILIALLRERSA
jgi:hypothetical protein